MSRALLRLACVLFGASCAQAASPLAVLRMGRVDYVRATDVAERLNLRLRWISAHQLEMADSAHRVELPSEGRAATIDGMVVYLGNPTATRGGGLFLSKVDYERRLIPLVRPQLGGPPPARPRIIALDPGHGGSDHGTENPRLHMMEKTFTIDVGLRLRKLLESEGYQVVMTRTGDSRFSNYPLVDLPMRSQFANLKHADLFISIHFNATPPPDKRTRGTEVFSFAPRSQRSSDSWGRNEDDSEPNQQYPEPAPANRNDTWNVVLANVVQHELLHTLHTEDIGEKIAHWLVLRGLNCPGILVESAFISNDEEAGRVATPAFRQQIAEALAAGIRDYSAELDSLRPSLPAAASQPAAQPSVSPQRALMPPQRPS
jgi:N-acetylmuramoyl-L-alanine amidase